MEDIATDLLDKIYKDLTYDLFNLHDPRSILNIPRENIIELINICNVNKESRKICGKLFKKLYTGLYPEKIFSNKDWQYNFLYLYYNPEMYINIEEVIRTIEEESKDEIVFILDRRTIRPRNRSTITNETIIIPTFEQLYQLVVQGLLDIYNNIMEERIINEFDGGN